MYSQEFVSDFISQYSSLQSCLQCNGGTMTLQEKQTFVETLLQMLEQPSFALPLRLPLSCILTALCILSREIQGSESMFKLHVLELCINGAGLNSTTNMILDEGYIKLLVNLLYQSEECRQRFTSHMDILIQRILAIQSLTITLTESYYLRMAFILSAHSIQVSTRLHEECFQHYIHFLNDVPKGVALNDVLKTLFNIESHISQDLLPLISNEIASLIIHRFINEPLNNCKLFEAPHSHLIQLLVLLPISMKNWFQDSEHILSQFSFKLLEMFNSTLMVSQNSSQIAYYAPLTTCKAFDESIHIIPLLLYRMALSDNNMASKIKSILFPLQDDNRETKHFISKLLLSPSLNSTRECLEELIWILFENKVSIVEYFGMGTVAGLLKRRGCL